MELILTTLRWYIPLLILGIIFFPLTKRIFGKWFPDLGYAFSKIIAILLLSYTAFVLGIAKILPFTFLSLLFLVIGFAIINWQIFKNRQKEEPFGKSLINSFIFIAVEEVLFFAALLFWVLVRGQEPSIRGLEKFMDFGFMNSILRSTYFPPLDMWLSSDASHPNGYFINYYYFGHLVGAFLIRLTGIKAQIGYNFVLATIFAFSVVQSFALVTGIIFTWIQHYGKKTGYILNKAKLILYGILGSFIVTLGGNLHTIYLFTTGYPNESPIAFWKILSWYNPDKYWYPNATRFIPYTIHEFPSYSWVVADLHGHVFDIPFVLLTLAILFIFFVKTKEYLNKVEENQNSKLKIQNLSSKVKNNNHSLNLFTSQPLNINKLLSTNYYLLTTIFLGFLTAVHYMTNAFDGPIYLLLTSILLFLLYRLTSRFFLSVGILSISFILFSLPFSLHFSPFVSGIGVNCSPAFLVNIQKLGPFLFEKGNCQISPLWMLLTLWGFFWLNFILFLVIRRFKKQYGNSSIEQFVFVLFFLGTLLIVIPEFFYIKDIYPAHFRANTMFKLGYQAFIIMGVASAFVFFQIKQLPLWKNRVFSLVFVFFFFFIAVYPLFSIPSYYGQFTRTTELDGSRWLVSSFPEDKEIIDYINSHITGQPVILEAQGDSYTDFERISAYTGSPTIAGWWVHEWLWRGSSNIVGDKIPDISSIYESADLALTKKLLKKYNVSYVVVSKMEQQKYPSLKEEKFKKIGKEIFRSSNRFGALYQVVN